MSKYNLVSTRNFFESVNNNIMEVDSSQHSDSTKYIAGTFGIKPTFDISLSFDQQNTTEMEDKMAHVEPIATQGEFDHFTV